MGRRQGPIASQRLANDSFKRLNNPLEAPSDCLEATPQKFFIPIGGCMWVRAVQHCNAKEEMS
jgi:hypothetical protein